MKNKRDKIDTKDKKVKFTLDKSKKNIISLVCNVLFVVLAIVALAIFLLVGGPTGMDVEGKECLKYFTVNSNILCALSCLIILPFNIRGKGIPKWALKVKFVGCVSVGVTMVIALTILCRTIGIVQMLSGVNILLHVIMPLLAILSFVIIEGELQYINRFGARNKNRPISLKESLLGIIPVVIYGVIYYYMVFISRIWDDIYNFNSGYLEGKIPIVYLAILALALIIGVIIRALHIRLNKEYQIRGYTL